jgi:multicomponent Na+:H+ antiporter subunit B
VIGAYGSQVVRVVSVLLAPLMMMFGLYVVAHGHYGPGGGFVGGIVIGVAIVLLRFTVPRSVSLRYFPPAAARIAAAAGVLIYLAAGFAALAAGAEFLDYEAVGLFGGTDPDRRYIGILVVEIGVGLAVTGVMVSLFDSLASAEAGEDLEAEQP